MSDKPKVHHKTFSQLYFLFDGCLIYFLCASTGLINVVKSIKDAEHRFCVILKLPLSSQRGKH